MIYLRLADILESKGVPATNETVLGLRGATAPPYRARIRLKTQHLEARGRRYELRPGMQVIAEIKQGERRVIEYLLSPVTGTVQEAGRER